MNPKTKKKTEQCASFCSILPICILVSILTAVLITLIFSIAFVRSFKFETKTTYNVDGAFKNAIASGEKDDDGITMLNGEAIVDFFSGARTGFIYGSNDQCTECATFGEMLAKNAESVEVVDIYHYEYDSNNETKIESAARNTVIGDEVAPVLIYVKKGRIYDRLDDAKSESDISTFLAKYK